MLSYSVRRLVAVLPAIAGVVTLVFLMLRMIPGDPAVFIGGENISPEALETLRERLGLSAPLYEQYLSYIGGLFSFDLGESLHTGRTVTSVIGDAISLTLVIAVSATLIGIVVSVPIGVVAAYLKFRGKHRLDSGITSTVMIMDNVPSFFLALLLMLLLSYQTGWFPISGATDWSDPVFMAQRLALPVLVLSVGLMASIVRVTRTSVLETLGEDYVRTARSLGASERTLLFRHALPTAALPIITIVGLSMGRLIAGTVIVEAIFSIPGMGTQLLQAITGRDYPVVQGVILLYAVIFLLVNVATDVIYTRADPRVRLA